MTTTRRELIERHNGITRHVPRKKNTVEATPKKFMTSPAHDAGAYVSSSRVAQQPATRERVDDLLERMPNFVSGFVQKGEQ